jgi:hypothetical protein
MIPTTLRVATGLVLSVGIWLAGCSTSPTDDSADPNGDQLPTDPSKGGGKGKTTKPKPPTPPAKEPACNTVASALCEKWESCSPFTFAVTYNDAETCRQRVAIGCSLALEAPGTSSTKEKIAACAQSVGAISCESLAQNFGSACSVDPGQLADGAACGDDAQCRSTFCPKAPGTQCGTCAPQTTEGGPCNNGACSFGLVCAKGGNTCIKPVAGKVGDPCTGQEQCDVVHAVGCNTNSKKCIPLETADEGGVCGGDGVRPTKYTICTAGGSCSKAIKGECTAAAHDGEACTDDDNGPHCVAPARCIGGTCELPDPAACQ